VIFVTGKKTHAVAGWAGLSFEGDEERMFGQWPAAIFSNSYGSSRILLCSSGQSPCALRNIRFLAGFGDSG
jgi:hypothetical protein